jgi:hypothetical protein
MKHTYNTSVFDAIDETSAYLLGVFMTDGCVKKNLMEASIRSNDLDWLSTIKDIICPTTNIYTQDKSGRITFYSKELCAKLNNYGCTPNKSITLKYPDFIPQKYIPDFIRGCWDGDGSIFFTSHKKMLSGGHEKTYPILRTILSSSSGNFIERISFELQNFNCCLYEYSAEKLNVNSEKKYKYPHFRLVLNNYNAKDIIDWMYYPGHKLSMPRKNKLAIQALEYYKSSDIKRHTKHLRSTNISHNDSNLSQNEKVS